MLRLGAGAEFEDLDVLRPDPLAEGGVVDHAESRGTVVVLPLRVGDHVVHMQPSKPFRHALEMEGMLDETEVLLDLGMTAVVPVADVRRELGIEVDAPEVVERLRRTFEADWKSASKYSSPDPLDPTYHEVGELPPDPHFVHH